MSDDIGTVALIVGFLALIIALAGIIYPLSESTNKGMKCYLGINQTIISKTWTTLNLNTIVYDDWVNSFNTTTYQWTVPETTRYLLVAGLMWINMADAVDCEIRFLKISGSGSLVPLYGVLRPSFGAVTGYASQRELTTMSLIKDAVYELQCYHDFVTDRIIGSSEGYTFLSITLLGNST